MAGWLKRGLVALIATLATAANAATMWPAGNCVEWPAPVDLAKLGAAKNALPGTVQGNVLVIPVEGNYDRGQTAIRAEVARRFYELNADEHDFLFVFSTFEFSTGDALAFYNAIKNDTDGIGQNRFDFSDQFGSNGRLQGYIDLAAVGRYGFNTRSPLYTNLLATMAHETMHRWGVYTRYRNGTGANSDALLGQAQAHWSYFASTDASLMYGAKWTAAGPGAFTASEIRKRFSWPDLYLAGLASANEFGTIELLNGPAADAARLPVLGARFEGGSDQVALAQIIAAEGARAPDFNGAQKRFRAGLILLTRRFEVVKPETLAQLERVRSEFGEYFSTLTYGRAVMEVFNTPKATSVVRGPSYRSGTPGSPSGILAALSWLRLQQKPDGRFEDRPGTAMRDTSLAIQALATNDPGFVGLPLARQWLAAQTPATTDALAWQAAAASSDSAAVQALIARGQSSRLGLRPDWTNDPWTAAIAGSSAIVQRPQTAANFEAYALAQLAGRDDWAAVSGGPARLLPAVYANRMLSRSANPAALATRDRLSAWIRQEALRQFSSPGPRPLVNYATVLATASDLAFAPADLSSIRDGFRGRQSNAGDWGDSVYVTSLAVLALSGSLLPDLQIQQPISVRPTRAYVGQSVLLETVVTNAGTPAPSTSLRWFRGAQSATNAITPSLPIAALNSNGTETVRASWIAAGAPGNATLTAVVDEQAQVSETREDNNSANADVEIIAAPSLPEIFFNDESVTIGFDFAQARYRARGTIQNVGLAATGNFLVSIYQMVGNQPTLLAEQTLVLAPQSQPQAFEIPFQLPGSAPEAELLFVADSGLNVAEADESNNRLTRTLRRDAGVDLEVTNADLRIQPDNLQLGINAAVSVDVRNRSDVDLEVVVELALRYANSPQSFRAPRTIQISRASQKTVLFDVPLTAAGTAGFSVRVDPENAIPETNEQNNLAERNINVAIPPGVNLRPMTGSMIGTPNPLVQSAPAQLALSILNAGTGTTDPFVVRAFIEGDPGTPDRAIGERTVSAFAATEIRTIQVPIASVPLAGNRVVYARLDADNSVAETNETDNTIGRSFDIVGGPDLAITPALISLSPIRPVAGQPLTVRARVRNLGSAAGAFAMRLRAGLQPSGAILAADQTIAALAPNSEAEVSWTFVFPANNGPDGVTVEVDVNNQIVEVDERNNSASVSLTLGDGQAFASEQYISPNGDGVQEETVIYFAAIGPAARIRISDRQNFTVRTIPLNGAGPYQSRWDGRNDQGVLVPDAAWTVALEDASGARLAATTVVVDTDSSPALEALMKGAALSLNLPQRCALPIGGPGPNDPVVCVSPTGEELIRLSLVSGKPVRIVDRAWFVRQAAIAARTVRPEAIYLLDDARSVIFSTQEGQGTPQARQRLWRFNFEASSEPQLLATLPEPELATFTGQSGRFLLVRQRNYLLLNVDTGSFNPFAADSAATLQPARGGFVETFSPFVQSNGAVIRAERFLPLSGPPVALMPLGALSFRESLLAGRRDRIIDHYVNGSREIVELVTLKTGARMRVADVPVRLEQVYDDNGSPNNFSTLTLRPGFIDAVDTIGVVDATRREIDVFDESGRPVMRSAFAPSLRLRPFNGGSQYSVRATQPGHEELQTVGGSGTGMYPAPWRDWSWQPNGLQQRLHDAYRRRSFTEVSEAVIACIYGGFIGRPPTCTFGPTGSGHRPGTIEAFELASNGGLTPRFRSGGDFLDLSDRANFPRNNEYFERVAFWHRNGSHQYANGRVESPFLDEPPSKLAASIWATFNQGRSLVLAGGDPLDAPPPTWSGSGGVVLSTLENTAVELVANSFSEHVELRGIARDRNFAFWELDYRTVAAGPNAGFISFQPPVNSILNNEAIMDWVPPVSGLLEIRLSVQDRAGNRAQSARVVDFNPPVVPPITDARINRVLFSPTGAPDRNDVTVNFTVRRPVALTIRVVCIGAVERVRFDQTYTGTSLGPTSWTWNGRDDQQRPVDDACAIRFSTGQQFFVRSDATPPGIEFELGATNTLAEGSYAIVVPDAAERDSQLDFGDGEPRPYTAGSWDIRGYRRSISSACVPGSKRGPSYRIRALDGWRDSPQAGVSWQIESREEGNAAAAWQIVDQAGETVRAVVDPFVGSACDSLRPLHADLRRYVGFQHRLVVSDLAGNRVERTLPSPTRKLVLVSVGKKTVRENGGEQVTMNRFLPMLPRAGLDVLPPTIFSQFPTGDLPEDKFNRPCDSSGCGILPGDYIAFIDTGGRPSRYAVQWTSALGPEDWKTVASEIPQDAAQFAIAPYGHVLKPDFEAMPSGDVLLRVRNLDQPEFVTVPVKVKLTRQFSVPVEGSACAIAVPNIWTPPLSQLRLNAGNSTSIGRFVAASNLVVFPVTEAMVGRNATMAGLDARGQPISAGPFAVFCAARVTAEREGAEVCGNTPSNRFTVRAVGRGLPDFTRARLQAIPLGGGAPVTISDLALTSATFEMSESFDVSTMPPFGARFRLVQTRADGRESYSEPTTLGQVSESSMDVRFVSPLPGATSCAAVVGEAIALRGKLEAMSFFEAAASEPPPQPTVRPNASFSLGGDSAVASYQSRATGPTQFLLVATASDADDGSTSSACARVTATVDTVARLRLVDSKPRIPQFIFDPQIAANLIVAPSGRAIYRTATISYFAEEPMTVKTGIRLANESQLRELEPSALKSGAFEVQFDGRLNGVPLPDGRHVIETEAVDGCGNVTKIRHSVTLDSLPPTIAIARPTANQGMRSPVLNVVGRIFDPKNELSDYQISVVGGDPLSLLNIGEGTQPTPSTEDRELVAWPRQGRNGDYELRVTAQDDWGNVAVLSRPIRLEGGLGGIATLSMVPPIFSPNADGVKDRSAVVLDVLQAGELTVQVFDAASTRVLATLFGPQQVGAGPRTLSWDGRTSTALLPDAPYTVRASLKIGADTEVAETAVTLDTLAPTSTVRSPSGEWANCAQAVSLTVNDLNFERFVGELRNDAGVLIRELREDYAGSYDLLALTGLDEIPYTAKVQAFDLAGNRSEATRSFTLDCTPPVALLTLPTNNQLIKRTADAEVPIEGSATDAHLKNYRLALIPPTGAPVALTTATSAVTLGRLFTYRPTQPDGSYAIKLSVEDLAGNLTEVSRPIRLDGTPPVIVINQPQSQALVATPLSVMGSVNDLNLESYQVEVADAAGVLNGLWSPLADGSSNVASISKLAELTGSLEGNYSIRVRARDQVGFTSSRQVDFRIDSIPPDAPLALSARVADRRHVDLSWTASTAVDLRGYLVFRGGAPITPQPITATQLRDPDLPEGEYVYTALAVDQAGNRSPDSNPARARIDRTAPDARLDTPVDNERIGGVYVVRGRAWSEDDFEGFTLSATPLAGGAAINLAASAQAVLGGPLADWDTRLLAEGARYRIALRARDTFGNVATVERTVEINNLPPAAPTGVVATSEAGGVRVRWNPNTEADLLGYVVYRNGVILGGDPGDVPVDLRPLTRATTEALDAPQPDGDLSYVVFAVDQAGNVSPPSLPATITLDTHAPDLAFVSPENFARFSTSIELLTESVDLDIRDVRFTFRGQGQGAFLPLGQPVTQRPYRIVFTPPNGELGRYEVVALATDRGNRVDPTPPQLTVEAIDQTAPAAPTTVVARATAGQVRVTWAAVTASDLRGYFIERAVSGSGQFVLVNAQPVAALELLDVDRADGTYVYRIFAVDQSNNRSEASNLAQARVFSINLEQPFSPTLLGVIAQAGSVPTAAMVSLRVRNGAAAFDSPPIPTTSTGAFSLPTLPLTLGLNTISATATDTNGNISRDAQLIVERSSIPAAPTQVSASLAAPTVSLSWLASASPNIAGYRLFRNAQVRAVDVPTDATLSANSTVGGNPERAVDNDPLTAWQPPINGDALALSAVSLQVSLSAARPLTVLEFDFAGANALADSIALYAWDSRAWIPIARRSDLTERTIRITFPMPYRTDRLRLDLLSRPTPDVQPAIASVRLTQRPLLPDLATTDTITEGRFSYTLRAQNLAGFESPDSAPPAVIQFGDADPPPAVVLGGSVELRDAVLSWTASNAADVDRYLLKRDDEPVGTILASAPRSFRDENLRNGQYRYRITAFDRVGNEGAASNEVVLNVAVNAPSVPRITSVASLAAGGGLRIDWVAASNGPPAVRYVLRRALAEAGPYAEVSRPLGLTFDDAPLLNGTTYYYTVEALDAAGNPSGQSDPVAGTPRDSQSPEPPRFTAPTSAPNSLRWGVDPILVCGSTEPGAVVTLRRGNTSVNPTVQALSQRVESVRAMSDGSRQVVFSPWGSSMFLSGSNEATFEPIAGGTAVTARLTGQQPQWTQFGRAVWLIGNSDYKLYEVNAATGEAITVNASNAYSFLSKFRVSASGRNVLMRGYGAPPISDDVTFLAVDGQLQRLTLPAGVNFDPELSRWTDDDRFVFATLSNGQIVRIRAVDGGIEPRATATLGLAPAHNSYAGLAYAVGAGSGAEIWLLADSNGAQPRRLLTLPTAPQALQFAPDGRTLAVQFQTRVDVYDTVSAALRHRFDHAANVASMEFARTNALLRRSGANLIQTQFAGTACFPPQIPSAISERFTLLASDAQGNSGAPSAAIEFVPVPQALPDLSVRDADVRFLPAAGPPGASYRAQVTLRNVGTIAASPLTAAFLLRAPDGSSRSFNPTLPVTLNANASVVVALDLGTLDQLGSYALDARVDPGDQIRESDESNNAASGTLNLSASGVPTLTLSVARTLLAPNEALRGNVAVFNPGSQFGGRLLLEILDSSGQLLLSLGTEPLSLASAQRFERTFSHLPGAALAASYAIRARLLPQVGDTPIATRQIAFQVAETATVRLGLRPQQPTYPNTETARLEMQLDYVAGNALLRQAQLRLQVRDPLGALRLDRSYSLGALLPGAQLRQLATLDLATLPTGVYSAELVLVSTQAAAQAQAAFEVLGSNIDPLAGAITVSPSRSLGIRRSGTAQYLLRNRSSAPININATARLLNVPALSERSRIERTLTLAPSSEQAIALDLGALNLPLGNYALVLSGKLSSDPQPERTLALDSLQVVDLDPPAIEPLTPAAGAILRLPVVSSARITDQDSAVGLVFVEIDNGGWENAVAFSPSEFGLSSAALAEGAHRVRYRAQDTLGNEAISTPTAFVVDLTPPLISITGVSNGQTSRTPLTPVITVTDLHLESSTTALNGLPFVSATTLTADGDYLLRVEARDRAGNTAAREVRFSIDTLAPPIAIRDPLNGASVATDNIAVLTASDPAVNVTLEAGSYSATGITAANGELRFLNVPLQTGLNTLRARARDAAGNTSEWVQITVTRTDDLTQQLLGSITPSLAEVAPGGQLDVRIAVEYRGTTPRPDQALRARLLRAGQTEPVQLQSYTHSFTPGSTFNATWALPTVALTLGSYTLQLEAQQGSNWLELDSAALRVVDRTPPQLTPIVPSNGQVVGATLQLRASARDSDSGIPSVSVSLDAAQAVALNRIGTTDEYESSSQTLLEGARTAQFRAIDGAGNSATASVSFVSDQTPPLIVISGVLDGGLFNQILAPQITITDPHLAASDIRLNGVPYVSGTPISTDGLYTLRVTARDVVNNQSSREIRFEVDRTPPVVQFIEPAQNQVFLIDRTAVIGSTEALARVQVSGATGSVTLNADASGGFQIPVFTLLPGANRFEARATDRAGNTGPISTRDVEFRSNAGIQLAGNLTVPAAIAHASPLNAAWRVQNLSNLTAQDLPARVSLLRGSQTLAERSFALNLAALGSSSGSFDFATTGFAIGELTVKLSAQLTSTQGSTSWVDLDVRAVRIEDRSPPTVAIVLPAADSYQRDADLNAEASDTLSAITSAEVRIDGGLWQPLAPISTQPGRFGALLVGLAEGQRRAEVRATDAAANSAISAARAFFIDRTPPSINISGVPSGLTNQIVTPVITITDASPVTNQLSLDGAPYIIGTAISSDGVHVLLVRSTDAAGNTSTQQVRFEIDRTPPDVTITHPLNGAVLLKNETLVTGVTEPSAFVTLTLGAQTAERTANTQGQFQASMLLALGPNTISARARDVAGNVGPTRSISVTYEGRPAFDLAGDLVVPTPELVAFNGLEMSGSWRYTGNVALTQVPMRLSVHAPDGRTLTELNFLTDLPVGASGSRTHTAKTTDWPVGNVEARLTASLPSDRGSVERIIARRSFVFADRETPQVRITIPLPNAVLVTGDPMVSIATDRISSIARVDFRIDQGNWLAAMPQAGTPDAWTLPLPSLSAGPHNLQARAFDVWENRAESTVVPFRVAAELPLTVTEPADQSVRPTGTADIRGLTEAGAAVRMTWAGDPRTVVANARGEFVFPGLPVRDGQNEYYFRANNAQGDFSRVVLLRIRGLTAEIRPIDTVSLQALALMFLLILGVGISSRRRQGGQRHD